MDASVDVTAGEPASLRDGVVRDDSGDLAGFFDLHRERRRAGGGLKLIDSGKLGIPDLERLAEAGVEVFSSDTARTDPHGLVLIGLAARKGSAPASVFIRGPFRENAGESGLSFDTILELARTGIRIAVSDGKEPRDPEALELLADACRKGGTRLVFYHAGPADASLAGLSRAGVWLHLDAAALDAAGVPFACDLARACRDFGGGLVLHVSANIDPDAFADLFAAGAFVLFHTPPSDYRDPRRALEDRSRRRALPADASYLFSGFML